MPAKVRLRDVFFNCLHLSLAGNFWYVVNKQHQLEPYGEGALGCSSSKKRLHPKKHASTSFDGKIFQFLTWNAVNMSF